jgi:hypothetical protein
MRTFHLVGIVSGNSNGYDQYTISEIEFRTVDEAIQFVRNYNSSFDGSRSNYIRAEYYGEIDAESGNYIQ